MSSQTKKPRPTQIDPMVQGRTNEVAQVQPEPRPRPTQIEQVAQLRPKLKIAKPKVQTIGKDQLINLLNSLKGKLVRVHFVKNATAKQLDKSVPTVRILIGSPIRLKKDNYLMLEHLTPELKLSDTVPTSGPTQFRAINLKTVYRLETATDNYIFS